MKIKEALRTLDKSWSREQVLLKIKKGVKSDTIIDEFLNENKQNIEYLCSVFGPKDKELLIQIEKLSTIEAQLINTINNIYSNNHEFSNLVKRENMLESETNSFHKIGLFMMKWSNKFVVITLLTISAIALSKQA